MLKNSFLLVIILAFAYACKNDFNSPEELAEYTANERNDLVYKKTVNGVDYTLAYRPTDLIVKQVLGGNINAAEVEKMRQKYHKYIYLTLSMSKNDRELLNSVAGDKDRFAQMVNELVFGMGEKTHLISSKKDTIKLLDYTYPRMYGASNETQMMFVYPRNNQVLEQQHLNFIIEDLGFGTGEVNFKINTKPFLNEPTLNF